MEEKIGIENIALAIPPYYLSAESLAQIRANGYSFEELLKKYEKFGIEKSSILYKSDFIDLGAEALWRLIRKANLKPEDISLLLVASESAPDQSKSLGTFVLGRLEEKYHWKARNLGTVELKFACLAGSYALWWAVDFVSLHPKKKVVILCLDEARYDLKSAAEPTQGAGSIAILVSSHPSLVSLELPTRFGAFTLDLNDFYRPAGKETPVIDGWQTIWAYFKAMKEAFSHYLRMANKKGSQLIEEISYFLFHNPYKLMVGDFIAILLSQFSGNPLSKNILEKEKDIIEKPFYKSKELKKELNEILKKIRGTDFFKKFFREKVLPSTIASSQTGNLYTGSLFLQLISLFAFGNPKNGEELGLFGFGSGAGALFYKGRIESRSFTCNLKEQLSQRKEVSAQEYEKWRRENPRPF